MNRKRKIGFALAVAALIVVSTSYFELISPYMAELSIKAENGFVQATYEHNLTSVFSNTPNSITENTSSLGIGDGKAPYLNGTVFLTGIYDEPPFFTFSLFYQFNASFAGNFHPTFVVASLYTYSGGKAYTNDTKESFNNPYVLTDNVSYNTHSPGGNYVTFHLTNGGILHHGKTRAGIGLPSFRNQSLANEFQIYIAEQNFVHNMTVELTLTTRGAPVPLSDTFDFYIVDPGVK